MSDQDRRTPGQHAGSMGSGAGRDAAAEDAEEGFGDNAFTGTEDKPVVREMARTGAGAADDPGLLSNLVQRTDNDFNGVEDRSLIGDDLPDEDEEDAADDPAR